MRRKPKKPERESIIVFKVIIILLKDFVLALTRVAKSVAVAALTLIGASSPGLLLVTIFIENPDLGSLISAALYSTLASSCAIIIVGLIKYKEDCVTYKEKLEKYKLFLKEREILKLQDKISRLKEG